MFPAMASDTYHEPLELLSEETKDTHRAIVSLMEELEAIDWYQQRAEACTDPELAAVLTHNKDEEVEHAMMTLEWLRRKSSVFNDNIATYLNSSGPITEVEEALTSGASGRGEGGAGYVQVEQVATVHVFAPFKPLAVRTVTGCAVQYFIHGFEQRLPYCWWGVVHFAFQRK